MVDVTKPIYGDVWANTGEKLAPDSAKIATGWIQEMMPYQYENFLQNRADTAITYLLQKGVAEWSLDQEYIANKSVVTYGANLYIATANSTNVLPTVNTSWRKLTVTIGSNGAIPVSFGGTGATTAADARTNLGIGSAGVVNLPVADGLLIKQGSSLISRTIEGTPNYITVANGDGQAGNPVINVGANVAKTDTNTSWTSTGSIKLPAGSTSEQGAATPGKIRFNNETGEFHGAYADGWKVLAKPATASETTIVDFGGYYTSGNVEGALQYVGETLSNSVLVFPNYTTASAAAATLPDGQVVRVESDPAYRGVPTLNLVSAGSLQFVALADPMKLLFGEKTNGIYYRYGVIYESKGSVEKSETRPFLHDFRPTVADGSAFNTDGANMFMGFGSGNFTMKAVPDADLPAGRDPNLQCSHNTGYGVQALSKVTVGYKNLALGNNAGRQLTDGFGNVFVGQEASREGTSQTNSVVIGFSAGFYVNANYDTIVGAAALYNNMAGNGNTVLGRRAGFDQTSGAYNIALGEQAGFGFTSGDYNIFIGKQAATTGYTTGNSSVVIGSRISGLQDENGQVVIADGAGAKHLEIHKDVSATLKKASYLELPSREVTPFSASATDGQVGAGSSLILKSLANTGNAVTQIVFQSRAGQPFSRIVSTGGGSASMVFINDNVERLRLTSTGVIQPGGDGTQDLGAASRRFNNVFAAVGTINTSDEREKQQWRDQSEAEKAAALEIKTLIKAFKFTNSVDLKGDSARWHFGVGAQTVGNILRNHGLNPSEYAFWCYNELDEQPEIKDENGNITQEYQPAGGRYGIRYDELAMFIIAAI